MPWWGWVLIALAVIAFIPIKVLVTKKFLKRMKEGREREDLDE
jgi:hypothetical protein